jgi:flagellar hook-length control protein FliK
MAPAGAAADSKNAFESSKTNFSDHLNDERVVLPSVSEQAQASAKSPTSSTSPPFDEDAQAASSEVDRHVEHQEDDAVRVESQAGIADSSQEVPSEDLGEAFAMEPQISTRIVAAAGASMVDGDGSRSGDGGGGRGSALSNSIPTEGSPVTTLREGPSGANILKEGSQVGELMPPPARTVKDSEAVAAVTRPSSAEVSASASGVRESAPAATSERSAAAEVLPRSEATKPSSDGSRARPQPAVMEQASNAVRPESGQNDARSSDERSNGQRSVRSLTELLSRQGITMEAEVSNLDPAMGRVREINQTLAHEQAIRAMAGATVSNGPAPSVGTVSALSDSGALEARTSVLSEVLSRSANESKLVERSTMITARGMNALASQRGGSLTIRLDPPSLGQVMIRMSVSDGVVQAELHASNNAGRVVMERGLETLRASLESRGLTVERLSVQAGTTSSESQGTRSESNAQDEGQQQSGKDEKEDGRQDAAGRESRGRHEERGVRSGPDDLNQQDVTFTQIMSEDAA